MSLAPNHIAAETAKILIETKSILFNTEQPFTYTSGRVGPVYIDCRRLISFPKERKILMNHGAELLKTNIGLDKIDVLAGGETAGIPYAAFLSQLLDLPMTYIRKKPKGVGRLSQIEGVFEEGQRTVLIEDLQNYGQSSGIFIEAIRQAGGVINDLFVLFQYGISDIPAQNMKNLGIEVHTLTNWWSALETAKQNNYFDAKTLSEVEAFLNDPVAWSVKNGGKGEEAAE
jgi:orotate phosphoribosyltransferase